MDRNGNQARLTREAMRLAEEAARAIRDTLEAFPEVAVGFAKAIGASGPGPRGPVDRTAGAARALTVDFARVVGAAGPGPKRPTCRGAAAALGAKGGGSSAIRRLGEPESVRIISTGAKVPAEAVRISVTGTDPPAISVRKPGVPANTVPGSGVSMKSVPEAGGEGAVPAGSRCPGIIALFTEPLRRPAALAALLAGILAALVAAAPALMASQDVLDATELFRLGVSADTASVLMAESLMPRARPAISPGFARGLARHGGDPLLRAYLDLDSETRYDADPSLSRAEVERMMERGDSPEEIIERIDGARLGRRSGGSAAALAAPPAVQVAARAGSNTHAPAAGDHDAEDGILEEDLPGDFNNIGPPLAAGAAAGAAGAAAFSGSGPGVANGAGAAASVAGASGANVPSSNVPGSNVPSSSFPTNNVPASNVPASALSPPASTPGSAAEAAEASFAYEEFQSGAAAFAPESAANMPEPAASKGAAESVASAEGALGLGNAGSSFADSVPPRPEASPGAVPAEPAAAVPSAEAAADEAPEAMGSLETHGTPFPVREPEEDDGFFMGTFQKVAPDGHRVLVHRNVRAGGQGTAIESTPDGRKLRRSFSWSADGSW
ncbi:MAG: hypothetical protein LBR80_07995 [Deltaproteobacteria bacterium]|jgi:hypothetical protein|nr:hypothetical protein [Deltaproteobacteria bacterium]